MSDSTMEQVEQLEPAPTTERSAWNARTIALGALPLLLLALALVVIIATDGGIGERSGPPIEELNVQRITLPHPGEIKLEVVNDGPDEIVIAQVLVDAAYWSFEIEPDATLDRLERATITIPYPWVEDEAHAIGIVSQTGVVFDAEIPVAVESPETNASTFLRFALIGFYVGVVPIAIGLLWYPFMRRLGQRAMQFVLALTIGLLAFLVVDTWAEAQEIAATVPAAFEGNVLVPIIAALTFLLLMTISRRQPGQARQGLGVAYRIAFGIGLHNLGEGLAIGAAFALGEFALGIFLIVGFTLHNVTEGVGIAAPILRERPALRHFAGLAALAGAPAIAGVWVGSFVYSPLWATIFLAVGIGALAQVVVEVARLITGWSAKRDGALVSWTTFGGVTAGIAVMYITALFVAA